ncbi:MAG: dehydratase, partial [Alphaproteobacteria bacterium]
MQRRKFTESRYFEDFETGEIFYIPSRTVGDGQFSAFQAASGDNHPIHY